MNAPSKQLTWRKIIKKIKPLEIKYSMKKDNNNYELLEGSHAIALTIKNLEPGVVSAYPITPQTHIVEDLAKFKADGLANYEYVRAESEFAAASIILGASAAGARVYSATSSQGLLLMTEVVFNIAGMRLPIVMTCANRAVSAPINIWCFDKNTQVLMEDLTYKNINQIKIGDSVVGKDKKGQLVFTKVTKLFSRYADDLVKLKTGESDIICTPEHEFYYHPGHKHWTKAINLQGKELHYFGFNNYINDDFKKGWLSGVADGDGCFYSQGKSYSFRLKCKDEEMADTFIKWANYFGYPLRKGRYMEKFGYYIAILTLTKEARSLKSFLAKKESKDFARGYLAGMYDAEGSGPAKVKQAVIYNNSPVIIEAISSYLNLLKMSFKIYTDTRRGGFHKNDNFHVKISNVPEFFIKCRPVISRKRNNLLKMSLKSVKSRAMVSEVIEFHKKTKVYNIETGCNNYIANGLLVHNCDHSDVMAVRDAGWILLFASNHQEAVDQHVLAYKIAEKLNLPVMVNVDGYIITHSYEAVIIPDIKLIKKYLPEYNPLLGSYLHPDLPVTMGAFYTPEFYQEIRQSLHEDLLASLLIIKQEYELYKKLSGRHEVTVLNSSVDNGLVEYYGPKKPKTILVALGSMVGTILETVKDDKNTGLLKIKLYRPFPRDEINKIIARTKNVAVIEKAISLGNIGPLYNDLKGALNKNNNLNVTSHIVGLGGRDVTQKIIKGIIKSANLNAKEAKFWA